MSKPNIRYIIVALLPESLSAQIKAIQKQYQNKLWKIIMPPHVTLLRPGTALADLDAAVEEFQNLRVPRRAVHITAKRVDIFPNGPNANVIYLRVEPSLALTSLHQALLREANGFMEAREDFGRYEPHITLANNVADEDTVNAIAEDLAAKNLAADYNCREVALFKKADTDRHWIELARKSLTG